jgi:hypothetical protein
MTPSRKQTPLVSNKIQEIFFKLGVEFFCVLGNGGEKLCHYRTWR